ncbi:Hsp20/alpha crystallin family protein [Halopiger djelfimassiliensis]|nr:Hsp20/alpha crystallin family protein [Halopiger djelfimassiliensis]
MTEDDPTEHDPDGPDERPAESTDEHDPDDPRGVEDDGETDADHDGADDPGDEADGDAHENEPESGADGNRETDRADRSRTGARDPDGRRDRNPESDDPRLGVSAADADRRGDDEHWLSSLLSALERLESGTLSGRRRSDRTVLDYDVSIGTADPGDESGSGFDGNPFAGDRNDRGRGRDRDRPRTRRHRSSPAGHSPSSDHHVTTRFHEDELLVTADVAGVDPDEVTVGFDGSMLVVGVSGRELDRVDVPWRDRTAEATIKNGVLTVQVRPGDADAEPEGDG